MSNLTRDILYDARPCGRTRLLVAIATLALGIGANCAIYTVVHGVLLKQLPFRDADRLVRVTSDINGQGLADAGLSYPELVDYRNRSGLFSEISGVFPINANLTDANRPERVEALLVDVNYFSLLGAGARLGRVFGPAGRRPGIAEVGVIGDGLWKGRYSADKNILGKTYRLDNDTYDHRRGPSRLPPSGKVLQTDVDVWSPAGWTAAVFNQPRGGCFLQGAIGG
jgi:putative ABC transport system permease protein